MLQNLHVKNLALIDEIDIEFADGLNILTGETGAGKSIIIGSINLALGARYTADILRRGADSGFVELAFYADNPVQLAKLKALEVFPEDGMVTLSRKFMEGRSISRINGETVSIGKLKETAAVLIDIHGQHEHQSLLYKKNHLAILDTFAKEEAVLVKERIKPAYAAYREGLRKLNEENSDEKMRNKEVSLLRFEIGEIREADLQPGEDQELEEQYRKMINGKRISENIAEAYGSTGGDSGNNASDSLSRAIRALQEIAGYDSTAGSLYDQLVEVDGLLNDVNREMADYGKSLEFSPEEFYEIENRLNIINHLKSKYGNSAEEITDYCEKQKKRLEELNHFDLYLEKLQKELIQVQANLEQYSRELTGIRQEQSRVLAQAIRQGLMDLNFADVQFEIEIRELADYTAEGKDEVEFMVSLNPGESLKPLGDVASGGELSRIMLAIKTVLADQDDTETLIFDEIDAGISGRTAQKVSEKLAVLAKEHQIICITHLAQIAAMSDAHYLIEKIVRDNLTRTDINRLDETQSVTELARLLGGAQITETVLRNAEEMKILAKNSK